MTWQDQLRALIVRVHGTISETGLEEILGDSYETVADHGAGRIAAETLVGLLSMKHDKTAAEYILEELLLDLLVTKGMRNM